MTDAQTWRIQQLEKEVAALKREVQALRTLRDQWTGMSKFAQVSMKVLIALMGLGGLSVVVRVIQWLNNPIKPH